MVPELIERSSRPVLLHDGHRRLLAEDYPRLVVGEREIHPQPANEKANNNPPKQPAIARHAPFISSFLPLNFVLNFVSNFVGTIVDTRPFQ